MKKIFLILSVFLFALSVHAEGITLTGETQFDWIDMTQIQRDTTIDYYKEVLFGDDSMPAYSKDEFKQKFDSYKRDNDYKEHYRLAKNGVKETDDANLCAFFFRKDILIIYAIQYKNNLRNVYYYDAYGRLKYVDDISEDYPNFPYTSRQYKAGGKPVSSIYFVTPDMQYMYKPDGEFKGLWYKENMYDIEGKQKVVRTNW